MQSDADPSLAPSPEMITGAGLSGNQFRRDTVSKTGAARLTFLSPSSRWAYGSAETISSLERSTPDGSSRLWFTGAHLQIIENERLVYIDLLSEFVAARCEVGDFGGVARELNSPVIRQA